MIPIIFLIACSEVEKVELDALSGLPPDFEMPDDGPAFISVADVKAAYDAQASLIFLDARPTVDYNLRHIIDAYSIPFYEVEEHFPRFPTGVWYIAYCGCPHSESGIVADYFLANGHETVGILDEGYLEWDALGYPTEPGE